MFWICPYQWWGLPWFIPRIRTYTEESYYSSWKLFSRIYKQAMAQFTEEEQQQGRFVR